MAQCPTCGSDVSENADFCPDCGTDLKAAAATPAAGGAATGGIPPAVPQAEPMPAPVDGGSSASAPAAPSGAAPSAAASAAPEAAAAPSAPPTAPTPPVAPAAPAEAGAPAAGGATQARLILKRSGAPTGEVFQIGGRVTIGRFDTETGPVDVDMGNLPEATYVSRQHAEMAPDASGGWTIKDLGSRNGVFVRKQGEGQFRRISGEEAVASGDEIALGNARFEFRIG